MAKKNKTSRITDRQRIMVDLLPDYNWDIAKSALAAGFSHNYATKNIHGIVKSNSGLSRLIEAKRQAVCGQNVDLRNEATEVLLNIIRNPSTKPPTLIRAIDILGKMNSWHSQTLSLESPSRQAQLTALEREEARRIAQIRFNALPAPTIIDGHIVDNTSPIDTSDGECHDMVTSDESDTVSTEEGFTPHADDGASYPSMEQNFRLKERLC